MGFQPPPQKKTIVVLKLAQGCVKNSSKYVAQQTWTSFYHQKRQFLDQLLTLQHIYIYIYLFIYLDDLQYFWCIFAQFWAFPYSVVGRQVFRKFLLKNYQRFVAQKIVKYHKASPKQF